MCREVYTRVKPEMSVLLVILYRIAISNHPITFNIRGFTFVCTL